MDVAAVGHDPGGAGAAATVLDPLRTNLKPKLATELVALALQGDIAGLRQLVGQHVEFLGENEGYHRVSLGAVCQLFIDRHYQPGVVEGALFVFHARSREQAPQDQDAHGWSGSFGSRGSFLAGSSLFKNWVKFKRKESLSGQVAVQLTMHKYCPTMPPANAASIPILGFEQPEEVGEGGKKERRTLVQLAGPHPWQPGKSLLRVAGLHATLSGNYRLRKGGSGSTEVILSGVPKLSQEELVACQATIAQHAAAATATAAMGLSLQSALAGPAGEAATPREPAVQEGASGSGSSAPMLCDSLVPDESVQLLHLHAVVDRRPAAAQQMQQEQEADIDDSLLEQLLPSWLLGDDMGLGLASGLPSGNAPTYSEPAAAAATFDENEAEFRRQCEAIEQPALATSGGWREMPMPADVPAAAAAAAGPPAATLRSPTHPRHADAHPAKQPRQEVGPGPGEELRKLALPDGVSPGAVIGMQGMRVKDLTQHLKARVLVDWPGRSVQLSGAPLDVEEVQRRLGALFISEQEKRSAAEAVAVKVPRTMVIVLPGELSCSKFCRVDADSVPASLLVSRPGSPHAIYCLQPAEPPPGFHQAQVATAAGVNKLQRTIFATVREVHGVLKSLGTKAEDAARACGPSQAIKFRCNMGQQFFAEPHPPHLPLEALGVLTMERLSALKMPLQARSLFVNEVQDSATDALPPSLGLALAGTKSTISLHLSGRPQGSCHGLRVVVSYAASAPESGPSRGGSAQLHPRKIKRANAKLNFVAFYHIDGRLDYRLRLLRRTLLPEQCVADASPSEQARQEQRVWEAAARCQLVAGKLKLDAEDREDFMVGTVRIKEKRVFEGPLQVEGADTAATVRVTASHIRQDGAPRHWQVTLTCPQLDQRLRQLAEAALAARASTSEGAGGGGAGASGAGNLQLVGVGGAGGAAAAGEPTVAAYIRALERFCSELRMRL